MTVKVSLELIRADRDFNPIGKPQVQECAHSWVEQMAQWMLSYLSDAAVTNVQDVASGFNTTSVPGTGPKYNAVQASADAGVVVGTSAVAPDRNDFQLGAKIADGNGGGQLEHTPLATTVNAFVAVAGGYRLTLEQSFLNDSGGDITVRETGVQTFNRQDTPGTSVYLLLHDLVSPTFTVVNGGAMIVRYHLDWLV